MSRHYFETDYEGKPAEVLISWSESLRGFFMVVKTFCPPPTSLVFGEPDRRILSEVLYDGLADGSDNPTTLDAYIDWLEQHNIRLPINMISELLEDRDKNIEYVNGYLKVIRHRMEGKLRVDFTKGPLTDSPVLRVEKNKEKARKKKRK